MDRIKHQFADFIVSMDCLISRYGPRRCQYGCHLTNLPIKSLVYIWRLLIAPLHMHALAVRKPKGGYCSNSIIERRSICRYNSSVFCFGPRCRIRAAGYQQCLGAGTAALNASQPDHRGMYFRRKHSPKLTCARVLCSTSVR